MRRDEKTDDDGYTLMEMVVSMGIMSIMMIAALGAIIAVYSGVNRTEGISFARDQVGAAFRRLDRELRYATWLAKPGEVGGRYYLEFELPTGCRQLIYDGGVLRLASWAKPDGSGTPSTPGEPSTVASELKLLPGTPPFQVYNTSSPPYASASPGTAGVGTGYLPEFYQVRLRVNAVVGAVTVPFDTLFTAQNTSRNTPTASPCSSGRPTA